MCVCVWMRACVQKEKWQVKKTGCSTHTNTHWTIPAPKRHSVRVSNGCMWMRIKEKERTSERWHCSNNCVRCIHWVRSYTETHTISILWTHTHCIFSFSMGMSSMRKICTQNKPAEWTRCQCNEPGTETTSEICLKFDGPLTNLFKARFLLLRFFRSALFLFTFKTILIFNSNLYTLCVPSHFRTKSI